MLIFSWGQQIKRYIGKKGQNLVEYALLLAIIVAIGYLIFSNNGLNDNIKSIFSAADNLFWNILNNSSLPKTWWWYPRN